MDPLFRLSPDCSLKLLEEPSLYDRATDELYIVSPEAVGFLTECYRGTRRPETADGAAFVDYCLEEGLIMVAAEPAGREPRLRQSPIPSLRYLLLHITDRCNLSCRHCFLGDSGHTDLPLADVSAAIDELERMQGLRLLVSGGEPLLHRDFWEINEFIGEKDLRSILLSNGTLIEAEAAQRLKFQEVQVSLDGMRAAHDLIRGPGAFDKSVAAIRALTAAGKQVSVATMIHGGNLQDFSRLSDLVGELGVREWSIDLPSPTGHMSQNLDLLVDPKAAGPLLSQSFGGAIHESSPGYGCGAHLMAVMANGEIARCGFYAEHPVGAIKEGLAAGWEKIKPVRLADLECDCEFVADCRGGCRFRAAGYNGTMGPDLAQCYRYGVLK